MEKGKAPFVNYSECDCWARLSQKNEKDVDVFFVYPTLFGYTGQMNMDISNDTMKRRVHSILLKQCSVFQDSCNVFAPYYRQVAFDGLLLPDEDRKRFMDIAYSDLEQAFDYYIAHFNQGRPFILAGHSQGTQQLISLMKNRFSQSDLQKKLVAAYLIGYSITDEDLMQYNWLKMAQSADDVGVIISYNTERQGAHGSPVLLENAHCINPLNWKTSSEYAPKEMNLGAVFHEKNGEVESLIPHFTDARIAENGALLVDVPESCELNTIGFPDGVYHKYDYSFFYENLKANVTLRINAYLSLNNI